MNERQERISEILNLVGYGLAKFNYDFISEFGFKTKTAFGQYFVDLGLANTWKAISNRQDSFDPYFDNGRKGWYQRNQREHIKLFIDSLFGKENAHGLANVVKLYIQDLNIGANITTEIISPSLKSRFKQLQETGKEAEFYFMSNYKTVDRFADGILEDARLWGDGYDFQIQKANDFLLAEVKGIRENHGSIRMTQNEYKKAKEYKSDYLLVIVSNLIRIPKLSIIENPTENLTLISREQKSVQMNYYSEDIQW